MDIFVQVINLDRSPDRIRGVRDALDLQSIAFERLSATDGLNLSSVDRSAYKPLRTLAYYGRFLTGGEVGCYRSHLRAAQRFLDSGAAFGLVLEDDATVPALAGQRLRDLLFELDRQALDWDLVNLGNAPKFTRHMDRLAIMEEDRALVRARVFPKRTTALLWSRRGARWFLDHGRHIFAPVDQFLHSALSERLTGLALDPPLMPHSGAPSEINARAIDRKVRQVDRQNRWYDYRRKRRKKASRRNAHVD